MKLFLKILPIVALIFLNSCNNEPAIIPQSKFEPQSIYYEIDLRSSDKATNPNFRVTCIFNDVQLLGDQFQFPATIPGVYDVYNYGAFVSNFHAYNKDGAAMNVVRLNSNNFRIEAPEELYKVEYNVSPTFDKPLPPAQPGDYQAFSSPYKMAGTAINSMNALLQPFAILGVWQSMTGIKNIQVEIQKPINWTISTPATETQDNTYTFESYEEMYDTPFIASDALFISSTSFSIAGTKFSIDVFDPMKTAKAESIKENIKKIMEDVHKFLGSYPVDKYNFLFYCNDQQGALEHNHSSLYVLNENILSNEVNKYLLGHIVAHEFFHTVTPLNLRSEIINEFSYTDPNPSAHLWFYEGVTDWAALMLRYRNGSLPLENNEANNLLFELSGRYTLSRTERFTLSLKDIGLNCYTETGQQNFSNVYHKGAMVAAMLDIKLLELSNGQSGLRELILNLQGEFNKDRPFSETEFNSILVAKTYPEIEGFLNKYINSAEELSVSDVNEYFNKIGISVTIGDSRTSMERLPNPTPLQTLLFESWSKPL
jgi:predicted metalloprotease with PDZ domain